MMLLREAVYVLTAIVVAAATLRAIQSYKRVTLPKISLTMYRLSTFGFCTVLAVLVLCKEIRPSIVDSVRDMLLVPAGCATIASLIDLFYSPTSYHKA